MKNFPKPPTYEAIATRAYRLWEEAGRPIGCDEEFWLRAEQQLKIEAVPPARSSVNRPAVPQPPPHAVPPVIREVVQPVARPPAVSRKRRVR